MRYCLTFDAWLAFGSASAFHGSVDVVAEEGWVSVLFVFDLVKVLSRRSKTSSEDLSCLKVPTNRQLADAGSAVVAEEAVGAEMERRIRDRSLIFLRQQAIFRVTVNLNSPSTLSAFVDASKSPSSGLGLTRLKEL